MFSWYKVPLTAKVENHPSGWFSSYPFDFRRSTHENPHRCMEIQLDANFRGFCIRLRLSGSCGANGGGSRILHSTTPVRRLRCEKYECRMIHTVGRRLSPAACVRVLSKPSPVGEGGPRQRWMRCSMHQGKTGRRGADPYRFVKNSHKPVGRRLPPAASVRILIKPSPVGKVARMRRMRDL